MRFLRTNTAVRVTVGPFFDKTDGVTPETALTVTSCKLTLMVDDANVPTLALDTAPTASGGSNDMVHVSGDDAGFYDLELTAANVNYVGRAMLAITDAANHCPVFHEFMILPAKVYDSLVLGSDNLEADAVQWLGGAIPAVNVTGVPKVDVAYSLGAAITNEDFTLASATSTTVTLPTAYSSGASLPDDDRYQFCALSVVAGTGAGQVVVLTTAAAGARVYNVDAATMVVQLDGTSKCTVVGSARADVTHVAGTAQTARDLGNALPAAAAGASGGLMISGSNAGPWTVSGGVTFTNAAGSGLTCSSSGGSGDGLTLTGNLTGDGLHAAGGSTGHGVHFLGGGTSGPGVLVTSQAANEDGVVFSGSGTGAGLKCGADAAGKGLLIAGGVAGVSVTTSAGPGVSVTPTAGSALVLTANGTSKHGAVITGGTAGTSDGLKAVAGTGGVDVRGGITGDLTGAVSTLSGYTDARAAKLDNLDSTITSRMASYAQPAGFLAATFPGTVASTTNITAGTITTAGAVTLVNGLAANVITTASIADDAITDAKIAVPAEAAGRPTRVLAMLRRLWEWAANKRTRDRGTGVLNLRNAADGATLETQTQSTSLAVDTITKGA